VLFTHERRENDVGVLFVEGKWDVESIEGIDDEITLKKLFPKVCKPYSHSTIYSEVMVIVVNYGTDTVSPWSKKNYLDNQRLHTENALKFGADKVLSYTDKDLPTWFINGYAHVLGYKRGAGYFIWKPCILLDAMEKHPNDTIIYMDSDWTWQEPTTEITNQFKSEADMMVFNMPGGPEKDWTKRDAFVLMGCDTKEYVESSQRTAGMVVCRKTPFTTQFMNEWLMYGKDLRIISDSPSYFGTNYKGFQENRWDQSIYSLLTKKHKLETYRDPSQYGLPYTHLFQNSPYHQPILLYHW
jgi:hypothetical protein